MASISRVALLGGTGFIGRAVVRALLARSDAPQIRVVTRDATRARSLPANVEVFEADASAGRGAVRAAVSDCDGIVNLIGLLYESTGTSTFKDAHVGVANALSSSTATVVQLSALGASSSSRSAYSRSKAASEAALPHAVVLRPSIVYGAEDSFFNRFSDMAKWSPFLPVIGNTLYQPVHVDDVAAAVIAALNMEAGVYELGGKDVRSFKELMQMVLRVSGRRRAVVRLPFSVASVQGALFEGVHAAFPAVPPLITRDQVELLKTDNVVSEGARGFAELGITPRGCSDKDIAYIKNV